jgi:hypothetical protein
VPKQYLNTTYCSVKNTRGILDVVPHSNLQRHIQIFVRNFKTENRKIENKNMKEKKREEKLTRPQPTEPAQ